MVDPKYAVKLQDLERRLTQQRGALDPAVRRAVIDGEPGQEDVGAYVEKVRRHAYKVTDDEVRALVTSHLNSLGAAGRRADGESGEAQGGGEQLQDIGIVLHHEELRLTLRRTGQRGTPGLCPAVSYPHVFHRGTCTCAMTEVCLGIAWEQ